jgi:hypothetical protein
LADGMESTATSIKLREGVRETVLLTLRDIPGYVKKAPAQPGAATADASSGSGSLTTPPPGDSGPSGASGRPLLVASIAGFGVAIAGGVLGTVFILKSNDTSDKSDAAYVKCNADGTCPKGSDRAAEIAGIDADANTQRGIGIGGLVVGGVGLAAGITLLILDQNRSTVASNGPSVTPLIGLNYLGVAGRF